MPEGRLQLVGFLRPIFLARVVDVVLVACAPRAFPLVLELGMTEAIRLRIGYGLGLVPHATRHPAPGMFQGSM